MSQPNAPSGPRRWPHAVAVALFLGLLSACADNIAAPTADGDSDAAIGQPESTASTVALDEHGDPAGLEHHRRWSEHIGQGAQPAGDVAFRNLVALGYTTVLSVDGSRPDVESAAAHGLTYVHVPIGYDGIAPDEAARIVKAVRDAAGPVYVHCHHGKHRGPAATMIARIELEGLGNEQAVLDMHASGTSEKYSGLYGDVRAFVLDPAAVAACPDVLPSFVEPAGLIDAMVYVDERFANLTASKAAAWGVPPENPDVDPPHEARMLWEQYREIARQDEAQAKGADFLGFLAASEAAAKSLEDALRARDTAATEQAFGAVKNGCGTCHDGYRNTRR